MSDCVIIGHKNPDTDCVCSAYAYAYLKSKIDKRYNFIAARCGNLNKQTAYVFKKVNCNAPALIKDIYPKVNDVMTKKVVYNRKDSPIYDVMTKIKKNNIRLVPLIDHQNNFSGIVSVFELSDFFLSSIENAPTYFIDVDNFKDVLPGFFYKKTQLKSVKLRLIVGAMPYSAFEKFVEGLDFSQVMLIVGKREKILSYAINHQVHTIILTGIEDELSLSDLDFTNFSGNVYISKLDTAETLRKITLAVSAYTIANTQVQTVSSSEYLEKAKELLLESSNRALPIVDEGKLNGIITRSDLIKKVLKKVILVDHNEVSQSVDGIETAEILEVIDHHRLAFSKTTFPIFFYAKPVGSTCTLVAELFKFYNVEMPKDIALILLSGIISDTICGKSPTTTELDIAFMNSLSQAAGVNLEAYAKELFSQADDLAIRKSNEILETDFKIYKEYGVKFGIGQVETTNINEVNQIEQALLEEIERQKNAKNLDWVMLLVSDIIIGDSLLLTSGYHLESQLSYKRLSDKNFYLKGVLSRKKQLLPEILNLLEANTKGD